MPDDPNLDAAPGAEAEPEPEPEAGTPPDTDDDGRTDDPSGDAAEPPSGSDDEPADEDSWKALERKYEKVRDPDERKRVIGKQYWEKVRYATEQRERAERAERELEAARKGKPAADERPEDAPPHPDIQRLDARIQGLESRDKQAYDAQNEALQQSASVAEELAKIEAKLEDADEWQRAILEQRKETLTMRKDNLMARFRDLADRREGLRYEHERLTNDRHWTRNLIRETEARQESERQSHERFEREFPNEVAALVDDTAAALKLPIKDKAMRDDLVEDVKARLGIALFRMEEQGISEVDIEGMVRSLVERYGRSRDLIKRTTFAETSRQKREVSGARPTSGTPRPAGSRPGPPKDVTALGVQDLPDGMLKARERLARSGL
jgi:hypothetical protein